MKRASRSSATSKIDHFARNAKLRCAALAVASAAGTFALNTAPVSAATVTWAGTISDPNSATYDRTPQGIAAGFVEDQNLYLWNTTVSNWIGAPTYTVGDHVIFTDNFTNGTDIRLSSGGLNPASITFKHIAGATPTTYRFTNSTSTLGNADFYSDSTQTENLSANTPFGNGSNTTLTLDTGFLGKVVLRQRSNGSTTTGNTIIRSGILELGDSLPLPHNNNQNQPLVTLDGGELRMNVNTNANTNPASTNLTNTLTVLSNSILSNGAITESRVWNGPVSMANGITLTLKSIEGQRIKLSNMDLRNTAGTIKLEDVGAFTTVVAFDQDNLQDARNAVIDLGTGLSELQTAVGILDDPEEDPATFEIGTLLGGANTKLSGSSSATTPVTSRFQIGNRNENSTFAGVIRDNQTVLTNKAALTKVGTGTLTLTGNNIHTGVTVVSGGTLLLGGAAGRISASPITIDSGGTLRLENTTNFPNRLAPAPLTMNQGNLIFQGNLAGTPTNEGVGALTITGGSNVLQTTPTGVGGTAAITFSGLARTAGVVDFQPDASVNVRINGTTLTNGILGGYATMNGNDWASIGGISGNAVIAYAGYINNTAPGGWLPAENINLTTGGASAVTASKTINSLRLATAGTSVSISAAQTLNLGTGGLLSTGTGGHSITGAGALTAGSAANAELIVTVSNASNTLTVSSPITDNGVGAVTLIKAGPGKLLLSGTGSTYTGGTQLIAGTLQVGVANFFPAGSDLTINYGTAFDVGGFNQSFGNVRLIDGSLLNSGGAASVSASTAYDVRKGTVNAPLMGAAALEKTTGGNVTLNAVNSYSGGTTVEGPGSLILGIAGALPAGGNVVAGGGTLNIGAFDQSIGTLTVGALDDDLVDVNAGTVTGTAGIITATSYNMLSGTVSAILAGSGVGLTKTSDDATVTLTRLNTYTGPTQISSGTIDVSLPSLTINSIADGGSPSAIGASSNAASNFVIGGVTRVTYNGAGNSTDRLFTLMGNAEFTSSGTGPVHFTNTGAIVGNGGILTLNGNNLGANTFDPLLDTSINGFTKGGQGKWVLTGNNTYTGVTTNQGFGTGVLEISSIKNGGVASNIGASTNDATNLMLIGGTLRYVGTGDSTDRLFTLGGNAAIESSGTGPLNFTNTGMMGIDNTPPEAIEVLTLGGTNTGANTIAAVISGNNSVTKDGAGNWTLTGLNTYSENTTANAGKLTFTQSLLTGSEDSEISASGGIIELTTGGGGNKHFKASSIEASEGGRVDLKDNKAIVVTGNQTLAQLTAEVKAGRGNGSWVGANGIGTSMPAAAAGRTGIATALNSDLGAFEKTTFGGVSVASTDMLLMYTYMGDANLDGEIDGDDYTIIDAGWSLQPANAKYTQGDFNYSGNIDVDDYFIIDSNYGSQTGIFSPAPPAGVTAVPEPAALSTLGLALLGLVRRRRRD